MLIWPKKWNIIKNINAKSNSEAVNLLQKLISKNVKLWIKKIQTLLKIYIKIEKSVIKFGDIEIEKQKFHQNKRPISIKNIDINKI